MALADQLVNQWMDKATPEKLRQILPGIFAKGTEAQFQAVLDATLTEAKRRRDNGT